MRSTIRNSLEEKFGFLFDQLNAGNTMELAEKYASHVEIHKSLKDYQPSAAVDEDASDLAD